MKTKLYKSKNLSCEEVWKRRMITEKGISEKCAEQIAQKVIKLTERMQYGHVMIAFHKQDGTFCLEQGTLVGYTASHRNRNQSFTGTWNNMRGEDL